MTDKEVDEAEQMFKDAFQFLADMDRGTPGYKERLKYNGPDLREAKAQAVIDELKAYRYRHKIELRSIQNEIS